MKEKGSIKIYLYIDVRIRNQNKKEILKKRTFNLKIAKKKDIDIEK